MISSRCLGYPGKRQFRLSLKRIEKRNNLAIGQLKIDTDLRARLSDLHSHKLSLLEVNGIRLFLAAGNFA